MFSPSFLFSFCSTRIGKYSVGCFGETVNSKICKNIGREYAETDIKCSKKKLSLSQKQTKTAEFVFQIKPYIVKYQNASLAFIL